MQFKAMKFKAMKIKELRFPAQKMVVCWQPNPPPPPPPPPPPRPAHTLWERHIHVYIKQ
jgi:hypothetical protein